jgi:hypothetical protein
MRCRLLLSLMLLVGCARDPQPLGKGWDNFCTVHGRRLRKDVVPIGYGTPGWLVEPEELRAMSTEFPSSFTEDWGGCVVRKGPPKRARVKYCPDCRVAEERHYRSRTLAAQVQSPHDPADR